MYKPKKEDFRKAASKIKEVCRKFGLRNFAIVLAIAMIGCAVWLNFVLFGNEADASMKNGDSGEVPAGIQNEDSDGSSAAVSDTDAYFASAVMNRQRARDEAVEVLQLVAENNENAAEAKAEALDEIKKIASDIEAEANIETIIKSKGFRECVAVISGDSCNVIVKSDGLLPSELAQIQEIVYGQSGILPYNLRIIEK